MSTEALATFAEGSTHVEVFDESSPYAYANLFHVKLRVVARFEGVDEPFERALERMGVQEAELARVKEELLAHFRAGTLPYLGHPGFPARLAEHQRRQARKVIPFPGVA